MRRAKAKASTNRRKNANVLGMLIYDDFFPTVLIKDAVVCDIMLFIMSLGRIGSPPMVELHLSQLPAMKAARQWT
jgi:hypothetical protein